MQLTQQTQRGDRSDRCVRFVGQNLVCVGPSVGWCSGGLVAAVAEWQVTDSNHVQVRRGDEFSLTCVVTSLTPIDVIRIVLQRDNGVAETRSAASAAAGWVRKDLRTGSAAGLLRWTVADNYDVKEPFSSLPRYRLYYSYKDGVATSTLTYRGTPEQSLHF